MSDKEDKKDEGQTINLFVKTEKTKTTTTPSTTRAEAIKLNKIQAAEKARETKQARENRIAKLFPSWLRLLIRIFGLKIYQGVKSVQLAADGTLKISVEFRVLGVSFTLVFEATAEQAESKSRRSTAFDVTILDVIKEGELPKSIEGLCKIASKNESTKEGGGAPCQVKRDLETNACEKILAQVQNEAADVLSQA
jgi:hypothetical protein